MVLGTFLREVLQTINKQHVLYGFGHCVLASAGIHVSTRNNKDFGHRETASMDAYKHNGFGMNSVPFQWNGLQNLQYSICFIRFPQLVSHVSQKTVSQCLFGLSVGSWGALGGPGMHYLAVGQLEIFKHKEGLFYFGTTRNWRSRRNLQY